MKTVTIVYVAFAMAWIAFFATQIVIPAMRGSKLFPFLRSDRRDAEAGLVEVTEESQIRLIEDHIARVRSANVPEQTVDNRGQSASQSANNKNKKRGV